MRKNLKQYTLMTLFGLSLLSSCFSSTPFKSVDAKNFEKAIQRKNVVLLDVRTQDEFQTAHIPNSINIDVLSADFEQVAISRLPKEKTIAVYCRSGKRSKKACEILEENGYCHLLELNSGFNGWVDSGKATEPPIDNTENGNRI